ncbi:hypothetical protein PoB_005091900 [Plakobranchus ocellatus]|uniref:Secreted protein n=1 Tax=Plakobranchus ocellatus TaxID=259542 RepID=A0AAV4BZW7_9GAST|nr:hypothetical protein PoB_005091900 [Plakobranchus ocellatus]
MSFYCMARLRNFRIIFAAVVMPKYCSRACYKATSKAVTGHLPALEQKTQNRSFPFPAKTTRSRGRPTVSRLVRLEKRLFRSCAKELYCVIAVQTFY